MRQVIGMPLLFLASLGAVALGVHMLLRPQRHLRGYIGGEMHRDLQQKQIQILGLLVIGGACWVIHKFIVEFWTTCLT